MKKRQVIRGCMNRWKTRIEVYMNRAIHDKWIWRYWREDDYLWKGMVKV